MYEKSDNRFYTQGDSILTESGIITINKNDILEGVMLDLAREAKLLFETKSRDKYEAFLNDSRWEQLSSSDRLTLDQVVLTERGETILHNMILYFEDLNLAEQDDDILDTEI